MSEVSFFISSAFRRFLNLIKNVKKKLPKSCKIFLEHFLNANAGRGNETRGMFLGNVHRLTEEMEIHGTERELFATLILSPLNAIIDGEI